MGNAPDAPVVAGLSREKRQVLITTTLDAAPDHRYDLAGESIWPLLTALSIMGTLMFGGIFNPWYAVYGAALITLTLFGWFWTATALRDRPSAQVHALPARCVVTDRGVWVKGLRKTSRLFIDMLKKMLVTFADNR